MGLTRRTWLWILAAVVGFGVICVIALVGFGMYFIANNVHTSKLSGEGAARAFEEVRAKFKGDGPLFDLDNHEKPRLLRNPADLPSSAIQVERLWVQAWDPDDERLVRVSLPFWILRWGRQRVDIGGGGFDFQKLQIDLNDLRRIGPVLVVDHKSPDGERVIVWTE